MFGPTDSKRMDRPGKVANPARGQLNRENEYFSVLQVNNERHPRQKYVKQTRTINATHSVLNTQEDRKADKNRMNKILRYKDKKKHRKGLAGQKYIKNVE